MCRPPNARNTCRSAAELYFRAGQVQSWAASSCSREAGFVSRYARTLSAQGATRRGSVRSRADQGRAGSVDGAPGRAAHLAPAGGRDAARLGQWVPRPRRHADPPVRRQVTAATVICPPVRLPWAAHVLTRKTTGQRLLLPGSDLSRTNQPQTRDEDQGSRQTGRLIIIARRLASAATSTTPGASYPGPVR